MSWIQVLNCQNCDQCLKCHKSPGLYFQLLKWQKQLSESWKLSPIVKIVKMVRIVKICQNCKKLLRLSKIVKIARNCQDCWKWSKLSKKFHHCWKLSKLSKIVKIVNFFQNCKNKIKIVSESLTISPIELCWCFYILRPYQKTSEQFSVIYFSSTLHVSALALFTCDIQLSQNIQKEK